MEQIVITPAFAADELGAVKADQAELASKADALKAILIDAAANGAAAIEGSLFRATVSFVDRAVVDKDAVIAELANRLELSEKALKAIVKRNTQVAAGVPVVRVVAKKGA